MLRGGVRGWGVRECDGIGEDASGVGVVVIVLVLEVGGDKELGSLGD